jgi:hypothetical protein
MNLYVARRAGRHCLQCDGKTLLRSNKKNIEAAKREAEQLHRMGFDLENTEQLKRLITRKVFTIEHREALPKHSFNRRRR